MKNKMSLKKAQEVMIVEPVNRIRAKIPLTREASVRFSEKQLKSAALSLVHAEKLKEGEQDSLIFDIFSLWKDLLANPTNDNGSFPEFHKNINKLKDLSALFSDEVLQDLIASLQKFLAKTDLELQNHRVIIQAHLNVINLTYMHKVKFKNSPTALKLFDMLNLAILQNT